MVPTTRKQTNVVIKNNLDGLQVDTISVQELLDNIQAAGNAPDLSEGMGNASGFHQTLKLRDKILGAQELPQVSGS